MKILNIEDVLLRFGSLAGISGDSLDVWRELCLAAIAEVTRRLRPDIELDPDADNPRLCAVAASQAYCDYLITTSGASDDSSDLRVGDIAIRPGSGRDNIRRATDFRDYFIARSADLLLPDLIPLKNIPTIGCREGDQSEP